MSPILRDLKTIPNLVSISRIILMFLSTYLYFYESKKWGISIGIIAGLTDYLDGFLARKLNQETTLGALLDLCSDLMFEVAALLVLILNKEYEISPLVLYAYLFREFWVTTIRRWMDGQGLPIKSNIIGKLKSNFLGWSFALLLISFANFYPPLSYPFLILGHIGLYGGLVLSYISGYSYSKQFIAGYNKVHKDSSTISA